MASLVWAEPGPFPLDFRALGVYALWMFDKSIICLRERALSELEPASWSQSTEGSLYDTINYAICDYAIRSLILVAVLR